MAEPKKERQGNIELLRIVAMLMIVILHYLDKGGILVEFPAVSGATEVFHRFLQVLCIGAVNLYVLISGYFLVESKFTVKKVVLLWCQVLFYAYGMAAIFILSGSVDLGAQGIYDLIPVLLPVTGNHYWFATVYLMMFVFSPFLNVLIRNLSRGQHKAVIGFGILFFSLWNTILPFTLPVTDGEGMDLPWFICLYLIAAYIRKYPDCIRMGKIVSFLVYFGAAAGSVLLGLGLLVVDSKVGKLGGYAGNFFPYNSLFTLVGSVALFLCFLQIRIKAGWITKLCVRLGACTFGVFLIHEHMYMRYLWPKWFRVSEFADSPFMVLHMIGTALAVFLACALIDLLRQFIFKAVFQNKFTDAFFGRFKGFEGRINGGEK